MKEFEVEKPVANNILNKQVDLLAVNKEKKEAIIVDWKFTKSAVKDIVNQNESHF